MEKEPTPQQKAADAAFKALSEKLKKDLLKVGLKLSPKVEIDISPRGIDISHNTAFASEITLMVGRPEREGMRINYGSSGSFSPEDEAQYWRTIHAAECLRHFYTIEPIINQACKDYKALLDQLTND